ncbi:MAG: DUF5667 domain-containing protein [Pseudonocardia sp.]|nr:DUF5667 domain-containing protein [Pseudonocardia sp.]
MSAGQGPADRGGDAERLAAAIEQGTPPGESGDAELARDLEIVAMLRSRSAAFDPHPTDRARAKQRLMAALAQDGGVDVTQQFEAQPFEAQSFEAQPFERQRVEVLRDDAAGPRAAELTAPMLPLADGPESDASTQIARVTDDQDAAGAGTTAVEAPDVTVPRTRRAGRHSVPSRPGGRARGSDRPAARGLRRRVLAVGAAAMVALIALAGVGGFVSRNALPGDTLYAMKRLAESTGTALTFDDQARAQRHLELATTRLDEVERLVERSSATGATPPDAALFEAAMEDFDASTGEGSRMLLAAEDASGPGDLGDLQAWAAEQAARLSVLRSSLPDSSVAEADDSIALLDRLLGRTESLEARSSCSEVTSTTVDDLGRLPAEGTCSPRVASTDDPTTEADESRTEDATGTATTAPDGTTSATDTADPTTGTNTPQGTEPEVLSEVGPDGLPLPGPSGPGEGLSTSTTPGEDGGEISLPLPLLPPMQLPPLLPGLPGVNIN